MHVSYFCLLKKRKEGKNSATKTGRTLRNIGKILENVLNSSLGYVEELEEGGEALLVLMAGGQVQHRHTPLTSSAIFEQKR
jgi:hypothetical protein